MTDFATRKTGNLCRCLDDDLSCPLHGRANAHHRDRIRELEEKLEEIANCDEGCRLCREGARIVSRAVLTHGETTREQEAEQ